MSTVIDERESIYYNSRKDLKRNLINQDAVVKIINPSSRANLNDSQLEWKKIIQDLRNNPSCLMDVIPTPKKRKTAITTMGMRTPKKIDIESGLGRYKKN